MRRAIGKHLADFAAVIGVALAALAVGGYILSQQRVRFPFVEEKPFKLQVELENAQAVTAGQGQTVRIAGVKIGDIANVRLKDGRALVELDIDHEYEGVIRRDATALLRAKTGLKDMFLEIDPGRGRPMREGERISAENTAPDIDTDEILSALDADTRDYVRMLIGGAGKGLRNRGADLRETFRRLEPLHRDLARVNGAVAERRRNLAHLVNRYGLLVRELGGHDTELTRLVRASNEALGAFAAEDRNLSGAVARLPGTLRQTETTLGKVDALGHRIGPALTALRPPFRRLAGTNAELLPLAREGTPIVRNRIRPFTRTGRTFFRDLGRGGADLNKASPDLTTTLAKLNRLINMLAFNPGGAEGLTGDAARDRNRQEGFLYWLAWAGANGVSVFSTADARGVIRRVALCQIDPVTLAKIATPAISQLPPAEQLDVVGKLSTSGIGGGC